MRSFFNLFLSQLKKLFRLISEKLGLGTPKIDDPDDGQPIEPGVDPGEYVCYYGCPNSNKAQKLQLGRNLYK